MVTEPKALDDLVTEARAPTGADHDLRSTAELVELMNRQDAGVPVINSHAGARAYLPMERNLSDALAARIAAQGGIVGQTLFRRFVAEVPDTARWHGAEAGTCDDVVAHWLHFAAVAGAQNVMLGSDFNGFITRSHPGGSCRLGRNPSNICN